MDKLKPKKTNAEILEIIIVVMLGVTALLTAWASWVGSLHGGNQSTNYTTSNNLAAEGNAMYNEASQSLMQDMMTWNEISSLSLDIAFAEQSGDADGVEKNQYKLDQILSDNTSEEFLEAINWALDKEEYASPFDKEGYVESYFEASNEKIAESNAVLEQGKQDNKNGDTFGLVTVVYGVVLFLLGIAGTFKSLTNRWVITAVSMAGFLFATIYMVTIPLPTGFSIMSFFGK